MGSYFCMVTADDIHPLDMAFDEAALWGTSCIVHNVCRQIPNIRNRLDLSPGSSTSKQALQDMTDCDIK